eukprot:351188-Hanusia_phi.AAC.1
MKNSVRSVAAERQFSESFFLKYLTPVTMVLQTWNDYNAPSSTPPTIRPLSSDPCPPPPLQQNSAGARGGGRSPSHTTMRHAWLVCRKSGNVCALSPPSARTGGSSRPRACPGATDGALYHYPHLPTPADLRSTFKSVPASGELLLWYQMVVHARGSCTTPCMLLTDRLVGVG